MEKIIRRKGNIILKEYKSSIDGSKVYYVILLPYYEELSKWNSRKRATEEFNKQVKAFENKPSSASI